MSGLAFEPSVNLTFDTVESDRKRLEKNLQTTQATALYLDLSGVKHCDSAGLALLIEAKHMCKCFNKAFEIQGMSDEVHALAEFCGVDGIL